MVFRWNEWNLSHIAEHGVRPEEAELVVQGATAPWPERREQDKWLVWGQGEGGRFLQVVYVVDVDEILFVIHARPLTQPEKQQYRRRRRLHGS